MTTPPLQEEPDIKTWEYRISVDLREKKRITNEKNTMVEKERRKYGETEESSCKKRQKRYDQEQQKIIGQKEIFIPSVFHQVSYSQGIISW